MSSSLREIKAKALAEKRKKTVQANENIDSVFFRQLKESSIHPRIIKQARQSGVLNLSNRGIFEMPDIVWNLNSLSAEETKALSLKLESAEEDRWWEHVDLTKLILASNSLKSVSPAISNYPALTVLDLHDNCLSDLPSTVGELHHLTKLNLSRNQFEIVSECVFQLKSLKTLQIQNNKLTLLNDDIGNLSFLEELDLSNNNLKRLPHCISFLSRLLGLTLCNNELVTLPVEIGDMSALKHLDVSKNKLKKLPESVENLRHLEQLYVQHNNITVLPPLRNCACLKELHAGFNCITELSSDFIESILCIKILDLRDNKIQQLPDNICSLQVLERLDVSNNALSSLPYTLGTLPHLKFLSIDGNPMRSIRRDIIQRGTVHLLKWLHSRIEDSSVLKNISLCGSEDGSENKVSSEVDKFALKSTRTLALSNKCINTLQKELIETAVEAGVTVVDLSKNNITEVPENLILLFLKITELNLGYNKLTAVPCFIGTAANLQYLNLRNNQLKNLPAEIENLACLREINICFNKFQSLPSCLCSLKRLEIILASDNQIESIDVSRLSNLPVLATLDLHNNSISIVPPELGNMTQLRSLLLDGNLFRNPRLAILLKGTPHLLEFLRSRIQC